MSAAIDDDLARADATGQVALVRADEITPSEAVDAAIARIERADPSIGALVSERFEAARDEAAGDLPDGPLRGLPVLLKDLEVPSAGDPYYAGTAVLRDVGYRTDHDGYQVRRLRDAGVVPVGRTKVPELGLTVTTEPLAFGPTRNPWDPGYSAGGSSGGSAAAVAAGMVAAATGTDGGGSLRIPASLCGIVGLKPTRGRISYGPDRGEVWQGFSVPGNLARSVRDVALLLDVTAGRMPGDPYGAPDLRRPLVEELDSPVEPLRVGVMTTAPGGVAQVADVCVAAVRATADLLTGAGHDVHEDHPAALDEIEGLRGAFGPITTVATARNLERLGEVVGRPLAPGDVEPTTWAVAEHGRGRTATDHVAAVEWVRAWARRQADWWRDHDLLVTPTLPEGPFRLGEMASDPDQPLRAVLRASELVVFTMPFNASGQPAVSLPLGASDEGLPVGVQVIAPFGREDLLIQVASALEATDLWQRGRPPLHVSGEDRSG